MEPTEPQQTEGEGTVEDVDTGIVHCGECL